MHHQFSNLYLSSRNTFPVRSRLMHSISRHRYPLNNPNLMWLKLNSWLYLNPQLQLSSPPQETAMPSIHVSRPEPWVIFEFSLLQPESRNCVPPPSPPTVVQATSHSLLPPGMSLHKAITVLTLEFNSRHITLFCSPASDSSHPLRGKSKILTTGYTALHDSAPTNLLALPATCLSALVPWLSS